MQIDKQITKRDLTQRILLYELIGFLLMTALILLDDVIDVPHLLRILPAPAKWIAIAFQIVVVIAMCSFVLRLTRSLLQRVIMQVMAQLLII